MQGSHWLPEMTGTLNGNNAVGIGFYRVPNGTLRYLIDSLSSSHFALLIAGYPYQMPMAFYFGNVSELSGGNSQKSEVSARIVFAFLTDYNSSSTNG
ncbi:MAG: hypothetical protein IKZ83_04445 [Prevotella sp.]|nr:hypothetical protein [Prevotella sp.]